MANIILLDAWVGLLFFANIAHTLFPITLMKIGFLDFFMVKPLRQAQPESTVVALYLHISVIN